MNLSVLHWVIAFLEVKSRPRPHYGGSRMDKLKKCPFCGSDNVAFTPDEEQLLEDTTTGFIWCHECGFSSDSFYSEEIAAEKWNQREQDG